MFRTILPITAFLLVLISGGVNAFAGDLYEALGVDKSASQDDIKKAHRRLVHEHHPDKHAQASEEERNEHAKKYRAVQEAYEILSDPEKRARYDRFGLTSQDTSPNVDVPPRRKWTAENTGPPKGWDYEKMMARVPSRSSMTELFNRALDVFRDDGLTDPEKRKADLEELKNLNWTTDFHAEFELRAAFVLAEALKTPGVYQRRAVREIFGLPIAAQFSDLLFLIENNEETGPAAEEFTKRFLKLKIWYRDQSVREWVEAYLDGTPKEYSINPSFSFDKGRQYLQTHMLLSYLEGNSYDNSRMILDESAKPFLAAIFKKLSPSEAHNAVSSGIYNDHTKADAFIRFYYEPLKVLFNSLSFAQAVALDRFGRHDEKLLRFIAYFSAEFPQRAKVLTDAYQIPVEQRAEFIISGLERIYRRCERNLR